MNLRAKKFGLNMCVSHSNNGVDRLNVARCWRRKDTYHIMVPTSSQLSKNLIIDRYRTELTQKWLEELTINCERVIRTMKYDAKPEARIRIGKVLLDIKGNPKLPQGKTQHFADEGDGTPEENKAVPSNPEKGG